MLKLIRAINLYNNKEQALYDETNGIIILSGDINISDRINGFIEGLDYVHINYDVNVVIIGESSELFNLFGFGRDEE